MNDYSVIDQFVTASHLFMFRFLPNPSDVVLQEITPPKTSMASNKKHGLWVLFLFARGHCLVSSCFCWGVLSSRSTYHIPKNGDV